MSWQPPRIAQRRPKRSAQERAYLFGAMYQVNGHDLVIPLSDLPQPEVGAPVPILVAEEHRLELGYVAYPSDAREEEVIAVASFETPYASMFGPPNDEAFEGHPLATRGLEPYGCFKVEKSSWIRQLEQMNSVHPYHRAERFDALTHYIFAFHDTTFECVAASVSVKVHPADANVSLSVTVKP
jgi:hypothetical protein